MSVDNEKSNFIWDIIDQDLREGRVEPRSTRFPPEQRLHRPLQGDGGGFLFVSATAGCATTL